MTTAGKQYYEATGRRKMAVARVRLFDASKTSVEINDRSLDSYFSTEDLQKIVCEPLEAEEKPKKMKITVYVKGGGYASQAIAIRLGIARALIKYDEALRNTLKKEGFLHRDARIKERKKFGLRKARRAPQWSKR